MTRRIGSTFHHRPGVTPVSTISRCDSDSQSNPQNARSYTTSGVSGAPHGCVDDKPSRTRQRSPMSYGYKEYSVRLSTIFVYPPFTVRSADAGLASIQSAPSETRDCQSGFYLLNALESGFHGDSRADDLALHVSKQIARLVPLIDGEFSRSRVPISIDG